MTTTCQPPYRGWGPDPAGRHELRWYAHGRPTSLVQDGGVSRYDPVPRPEAVVVTQAPSSTEEMSHDVGGPQGVGMVTPADAPIELGPDPLAAWFSSEGPSPDFWSRPGRRKAEVKDGRWRYGVAVRRRR